MENLFSRADDTYQRNINPISDYIKLMTSYVSNMKGISLEEAEIKVRAVCKQTFKDPSIRFNDRDFHTTDMVSNQTTLSKYIKDVNDKEKVLAPTFTTYFNHNERKSLLSKFIDANVKRRSKAKKEAAKAKDDGLMDLYVARDNDQANMKIYNNSLSGAFAQAFSLFCNPTAHSTLTSMTRTVSSLGSASNEKIISGNRHYYNPHVIMMNLITVVNGYDKPKFKVFMDKYNLYQPRPMDVLNVIKRSSDFYFKDEDYLTEQIKPYLNTLDGYDRAAFCYIGDLFHLRVFNENTVKTFLTKLSKRVTDQVYDDPFKIVRNTSEGIVNLTHQICFDLVKGNGKELSKFKDLGILDTVAGTVVNIENTLIEYRDLIDNIFLSDNIPSSVAYIKDMVRRTIVLGDTDSTCFSVDEWVKWYFGDIIFNQEATAVASSVSFLATETIAHLMSILSANLNVPRENLHTLSMKNEYLWTVHLPTAVSKHYAALTVMKEGSVFKEAELELKGVHLKNSAVPPFIIKNSNEIIEYILNSISSNQKVSILHVLNNLKTLELDIKNAILAGQVTYFKKTKVKNADSYANNEELSPYQRHVFWNTVFGPSYSMLEPPPYDVYKIPLITDKPSLFKPWIVSIEDKELSSRLSDYMNAAGKKNLATFYIEENQAKAYGVPKEIIPVIDINSIIIDITKQHRIILDSLGYYIQDDVLLSDIV